VRAEKALLPKPPALRLDEKPADSCAPGVLQTSAPSGTQLHETNEKTGRNEKSQVFLALLNGGGGN